MSLGGGFASVVVNVVAAMLHAAFEVIRPKCEARSAHLTAFSLNYEIRHKSPKQ